MRHFRPIESRSLLSYRCAGCQTPFSIVSCKDPQKEPRRPPAAGSRQEDRRVVLARDVERHEAVVGELVLMFGPRFCACAHWPSGSFWVTQMSAPPAARAPAHEVERLAVGLIHGSWSSVAVDGIGEPLGDRPVRPRPGPLAGLADPVRDEDVGRRAQDALVAAAGEAGEVDRVSVRP